MDTKSENLDEQKINFNKLMEIVSVNWIFDPVKSYEIPGEFGKNSPKEAVFGYKTDITVTSLIYVVSLFLEAPGDLNSKSIYSYEEANIVMANQVKFVSVFEQNLCDNFRELVRELEIRLYNAIITVLRDGDNDWNYLGETKLSFTYGELIELLLSLEDVYLRRVLIRTFNLTEDYFDSRDNSDSWYCFVIILIYFREVRNSLQHHGTMLKPLTIKVKRLDNVGATTSLSIEACWREIVHYVAMPNVSVVTHYKIKIEEPGSNRQVKKGFVTILGIMNGRALPLTGDDYRFRIDPKKFFNRILDVKAKRTIKSENIEHFFQTAKWREYCCNFFAFEEAELFSSNVGSTRSSYIFNDSSNRSLLFRMTATLDKFLNPMVKGCNLTVEGINRSFYIYSHLGNIFFDEYLKDFDRRGDLLKKWKIVKENLINILGMGKIIDCDYELHRAIKDEIEMGRGNLKRIFTSAAFIVDNASNMRMSPLEKSIKDENKNIFRRARRK